MSSADQSKSTLFKKAILKEYPDISLFACSAFDLINAGGSQSVDLVTPDNNRIVISGECEATSLKRTIIYFAGRNNSVVIDGLRNVFRLELACTKGSSISIRSATTIRGMTIFCSHGASATVGRECMSARDVLIYASKAHGLYNVSDGSRRFRDKIVIGDHVWLGQGVKILGGAVIGDGSVIGSYSVLARAIPNNCAAAGNPCRVTTRNIFWTADAVQKDGNYFEMLKETDRSMPYFVRNSE